MKMADYRSSSRKDGKYQVNLTNCNIQTVVIGNGTTVNTCCRRAERSTASRSGPTVIQDGGEWRGTKRKQKLLVDNTSVKEFVTMDIIVICILYLIIVTIHVHVSCRYQPTLESLDSRPLHSWYAEFKIDPEVIWAEPLTKSDARYYPQVSSNWNSVINGRHRNRAAFKTFCSKQFTCSNQQHIPMRWRCDGDSDCSDNSDENGCVTEKPHQSTYSAKMFHCADGNRIQGHWLCDGEDDCADGSDEQGCPIHGNCTCDQFSYHGGGCIPSSKKCDGTWDCKDAWSDETACDCCSQICEAIVLKWAPSNPRFFNDGAIRLIHTDNVKINTYKPDYLWSDGSHGPDIYWQSREFLAWLYIDSPVKDMVVTSDRCCNGGVYTCSDSYNPGTIQNHKWENTLTVDKGSWGYRRDVNIDSYLEINQLLYDLASTVSCGATADGRIIPAFEEHLLQMGRWLSVNGEAITAPNLGELKTTLLTKMSGTRPKLMLCTPLFLSGQILMNLHSELQFHPILLKLPC